MVTCTSIQVTDSFITEGSYKGSYLTVGLFNYCDIAKPNGTITNNVITFTNNSLTTTNRKVTASTNWVYVNQITDDHVRLSRLPGVDGYFDLLLKMNYDKSFSIDPQSAYSESSYGDFNCYPMTETVSGTTVKISAQILSPIAATCTAGTDSSTVKWGEWLIGSTSYGLFGGLYESSAFKTAEAFTFPTKPVAAFEGAGTQASPYQIKTLTDLNALAVAVNSDTSVRGSQATDAENSTYYPAYEGKYFTLVNDLDYSTYKSAIDPIGNKDVRFAGTFDGGGHTIANYKISDYAYDYCGLFGCTAAGSTVKNLKFTSPVVKSMGYIVGVVAGKSFGTIDSCEVSNAIVSATAGYNVGTIAGYSYGKISNSKATGSKISALGYIGGIVGRTSSDIANCSATSTITVLGKSVFAGGIVGYALGTEKSHITISKCSFAGTLASTSSQIALGGLCGGSANVDLSQSFATSRLYATSGSQAFLGGLIGSIWQSQVNDCYASGSAYDTSSPEVGGLIGNSAATTSTTESYLNRCYSSVIVNASVDSIVGLTGNSTKLKFTDCYYDNQMTNVSDSVHGVTTATLTSASGIKNYDSSVWQFTAGLYPRLKCDTSSDISAVSASAVTLVAPETVKQVKSDFTYSTANNVTWTSIVDGASSSTGGHAFTFNNGKAVLNWKQSNDTLVVTRNDVSKIIIASIAPMPFSGDGSEASPWEIATKKDLEELSTISNSAKIDFEGYFIKVVADIDAQGDTITPICNNNNYTPKTGFKGTFDGNGHTIHNMVVSTVDFYGSTDAKAGQVNPRSSKSVNNGGLFGCIMANGVVKNVVIAADNKFDLFSTGGAIAGYCFGTIKNCENYAPVTAYYSNAGGIAGQLATGAVVSGCYNAGTIHAGSNTAGGIVGYANSATIENCDNAGEVGAIYINDYQADGRQSKAGGIIGSNYFTTVNNVVNSGHITSHKQVGGIAGYCYATATAKYPTIVENAVNYGTVNALDELTSAGQIVGDNLLGTYKNNYFDRQLTKIGGVNNANVSGTSALKVKELIAGNLALDSTLWKQTANSYPVLASFKGKEAAKLASLAAVKFADADFASYVTQTAPLENSDSVKWSLKKGNSSFAISNNALNVTIPTKGIAQDTLVAAYGSSLREISVSALNVKVLDGDGTEQNPYLIKTPQDMLTLSNFVETSGFDYEGSHFLVVNNLDFTGTTYQPVAYGRNIFQGNFNGNGKTISHLVYSATASTDKDLGLFGTVGGSGIIRNLTLDETDTLTAYQRIGAFVGSLYGSVDSCVNKGVVKASGSSYAGGIAGYANPASAITNCANSGNISATTSYAGGIVGASPASASVKIENCSNNGAIATGSFAGGIAGCASADIKKCKNTGSITATTAKSFASGIIGGALTPSSIRLSNNSGNISATEYIGGIVGSSSSHKNASPFVIDSCYNTVDFALTTTCKGYVGGIGGALAEGTQISNCYNTGSITSTSTSATYCAGIAGYMSGSNSGNSSFTNCYNTGAITAERSIGGIAGLFSGDSSSVITDCYNLGNLTSNNASSAYTGGLVGTGGYYVFDSWNAGDVTAKGTNVGGISGYLSGAAYKFERNFNVGKVTSTTDKGTDVGGLIGMGRPVMQDCYNFGDVSGYDNVGGLMGLPGNAHADIYCVRLHRSYNAAKVTATGDNAGNICAYNSNCEDQYFFADSVYYDKSVQDSLSNDKIAVGLSHNDIIATKIGSAFDNSTATYPSLKVFAHNPYNSFAVATIELDGNETTDSVANNFKIGTPDSTVWTSSSNLIITDNDVKLANTQEREDATLTLTVGKLTRTYNLKLIHKPTGVNNTNVSKEVLSRTYYTTNGIEVPSATAITGVVIEKTTYTDGTFSTRKLVSRAK
jgi:hypothetical protein